MPWSINLSRGSIVHGNASHEDSNKILLNTIRIKYYNNLCLNYAVHMVETQWKNAALLSVCNFQLVSYIFKLHNLTANSLDILDNIFS